MTRTTTCPHCKTRFSFVETAAGKTVQCSNCQKSLEIPADGKGSSAAVGPPEIPKQPGVPQIQAPPVYAKSANGNKKRKTQLIVLALATVGVLSFGCVAMAGIWYLMPQGGLGAARIFVPDDCERIQFMRFDKLTKNVPEDYLEEDNYLRTKLDMDEIKWAFSGSNEDGESINIIYLKKEQDLEDVVDDELGDSERYKRIKIYTVGSSRFPSYWAKLDDKIVARASKKELMESAIKSYKEKKKEEVDKYMQEALNDLKNYHAFFIRESRLEDAKAAGFGFSYKSGLKLRGVHVFKSVESAKDGLDELNDLRDDTVDQMNKSPSSEKSDSSKSKDDSKSKSSSSKFSDRDKKRRKRDRFVADLLERAKIKRSGKKVTIDLKVSKSEIDEFAEVCFGDSKSERQQHAFGLLIDLWSVF